MLQNWETVQSMHGERQFGVFPEGETKGEESGE